MVKKADTFRPKLTSSEIDAKTKEWPIDNSGRPISEPPKTGLIIDAMAEVGAIQGMLVDLMAFELHPTSGAVDITEQLHKAMVGLVDTLHMVMGDETHQVRMELQVNLRAYFALLGNRDPGVLPEIHRLWSEIHSAMMFLDEKEKA